MTRRRLLCALLVVSIAGCGTPFYVRTEPRQTEIWVDGRFVGIGSATVPTNGIVFNSYRVEARDGAGKVLNEADVNVTFGPRSAVCAGVGLVGILIWPLLPLLPAAFFVGEPDVDHLHLRVPLDQEPSQPPPPPDELDRPVIDFAEPAQGEQFATASTVTVKGRARHWSGVGSIVVEVDGAVAKRIAPGRAETECAFEATVTVDAPGPHVIKVTASGVRGAPAVEEVRITRVAK